MTDHHEPPPENPRRRHTDDGTVGRLRYWWTTGRGYRDLWLIGITGLVVVALSLNSDRVDDIQTSRAEATQNACTGFNDAVQGINDQADVVADLIISGAVLPGDTPSPEGPPQGWKTIDPGPLSGQIEDIAPDFPEPQERLDEAMDNAQIVLDTKTEKRDCDAEVAALKAADGG